MPKLRCKVIVSRGSINTSVLVHDTSPAMFCDWYGQSRAH